MDTLILTEQQAAELEAANGNSMRRLKARRLTDGRLILNADVLDDPLFVDRSRGWAATLLAPEEISPEQTNGTDVGAEVGIGEVGVSEPVVLATGVQRLTLGETDLV